MTGSSCNNVVLGYTLNVFFEQIVDSTGYRITEIKADLIYGDVSDPEGSRVVVQRTSTVNFIQNANDRLNSGAPGYAINSAIKIGSLSAATVIVDGNGVSPIDELKHGLRMRGADNEGQCYYVKQGVTDPTFSWPGDDTVPLIETVSDLNFFEDPLLTITDSTLYGCHLDLTLDELEDFCVNDKFKFLMLFQNMESLQMIGKFGVSNPNFFSDWIEVEKLESVLEAEFNINTCQFPSTAVLRVFYEKFGWEEEPQFRIVKADFNWSPDYNEWKFDRPATDQKQRFFAQLAVQFYVID